MEPTLQLQEFMMDEYAKELSRILRELLATGAKRDYDRMIDLAKATV